MRPLRELRRNSKSFLPASSRAFTTPASCSCSSSSVTLVPAVIYRPDSTVQRSPRGMPVPALAPSKQDLPSETFKLPPPDIVPIVELLPPKSEPSPTNTPAEIDRKSTRLNSSHVRISYAVFCLKKK